MEFSISSYAVFHEAPKRALDILSEHTKHVEWMLESYHSLASIKLLQDYDLLYSIHAPFLSINLSTFDEIQRKLTISSLEKAIKYAFYLDAECVVVHPGYYYTDDFHGRSYARMVNTLDEVKKIADVYEVKLAVENLGNWDTFAQNLLQSPKEMIAAYDFCLDIGHANLCRNLNDFLNKPFQHIHIHDNFGEYDGHNELGSGNIDFSKVIDAIKRNKIEHPVVECCTLDKCLTTIHALDKFM